MGVPSFNRWIVDKYPKVVARAIEVVDDTNFPNPNGVEFDNLYLDMNAIIHPCFHNSPRPKTFEDVFKKIFDYIDRLVSIVRPRKLLYMAIDGVAPRAKMNQQRAGRFRTAKDRLIREAEEERLRKQFEMEGKLVLPKIETELSDPNIITPGTVFMHELSKALQSFITSRIACSSLWTDIMVILSDANVPGEGEHKIMSYIRRQRSLPEYDPNTSHCSYGPDADLIMLAMATHELHFSILREELQQQNPAKSSFEFFHIWLLREYLELDMKIEDPPKNYSIDFERIIDDFIFMCFFAGNDFLPPMPSLLTHERAIDLLLTVYKKEFNKLGGYLVDMNKVGEKEAAFVKLSRVENFILMVGAYEEKIFKKRSEIRERKLRRLISDYEDAQEQENGACFSYLEKESSSDAAHLINKASSSKDSSVFLVNNVLALPAEEFKFMILHNTKDLKEQVNKCIREKSDLFKSGEFLTDNIKLGTAGWKERYYKYKFSVEGPTEIESMRKKLVQKYTEGLLWVLQYYFSGVPSWSWFYPYHYCPFASDLKGMGQVRVNFVKGVPFLPFDQLLSMLPPSSAHALPNAYAQLMVDEQSKIHDFYPLDFEVDTEGKLFLWQATCKLPFIDENILLAETRELKNGLSESEAIRNSVNIDRLFVRSTSKLAAKICSLPLEPNPCFKLDTSISDGIGGVISLCHEEVEKPGSGIKIHDNLQENHVLCVFYELPVGTRHIPRLLSNVNLPTKTIFGDDIMETKLWHERQRHSRFEWSANSQRSAPKFSLNATSEDRRSFLLNSSPETMHKGAGVGWGSGRGKLSNSPNLTMIDTVANERMSSLSHSHKQQPNGAGSYKIPAMRDTRPQQFVDSSRQFRISEPNQLPRPSGNGLRNQFNIAPYQGSQSGTMPYGRGRGRLQHGSNDVNSGRSVSTNSSLGPRWNGAKDYQVKDQNRW